MLGLDTHVITRIVLADDPAQTAQALAAIAQAQVLRVFKALLETQDLHIDQEQVLEQAVYVYEHGSADFPECLFWAQYQRMGCRAMLTFDAKAARIDGVELVSSPG